MSCFISLRFAEAKSEALLLKSALEEKGISTFLCDILEGGDIAAAIIQAIDSCELCIIMGSETYGTDSGAGFSTFEELRFIIDEKKPFFLVKMCEKFTVPETRFRLGKAVSYFPWGPGQPMPNDIVGRIIDKLDCVRRKEISPEEGLVKQSSASSHDARMLLPAPVAHSIHGGDTTLADPGAPVIPVGSSSTAVSSFSLEELTATIAETMDPALLQVCQRELANRRNVLRTRVEAEDLLQEIKLLELKRSASVARSGSLPSAPTAEGSLPSAPIAAMSGQLSHGAGAKNFISLAASKPPRVLQKTSLRRAVGMCELSEGVVAVVDSTAGHVCRVHLDDSVPAQVIPGSEGRHPWGICAVDGDIVVTYAQDSMVRRIGNLPWVYSGVTKPLGVCVLPDGMLAVVDFGGLSGPSRLLLLTADGVLNKVFGVELHWPTGVTATGAGNLIVAQNNCFPPWRRMTKHNQLVMLSREGAVLQAMGPQGSRPGELNYPEHVAVDGAGYLLACDCANRRVAVFRPDGGVAGSVPVPAEPRGLLVTRAGSVIVSLESGKILVFE